MNYKINLFGFVFSFVFLIGMGNIAWNFAWYVNIGILFVAAYGYALILHLSEGLVKK